MLGVLALAVASPRAQEGWFEGDRDRVELPMVLTGSGNFVGTPLMRVDMGGEGLLVLLDTGFNSLAIDRDVAKRLELDVRGHDLSLAIGGASKTPLYRCPTFAMGDARLEAPVVYGLRCAAFGRDAGLEVDAIFGAGFFGQFVVVLDYPARRVELIDPETFEPPEGAEPIRFGGILGQPLVQASVGGSSASYTFMFDTGAGPSVILYEAFTDRRGIDTEGLPSIRVRGLHGLADSKLGSIPDLALGGRSLGGAPAIVLDRPETFGMGASDAHAGILGTGLWSGHRVTLDYTRRQLYLEKVVDAPAEAWPMAFMRAENGLEVAAVVATDPPLDLERGDRLLAVEGEAVPETLDGLKHRLQSLDAATFRFGRGEAVWDQRIERAQWPELEPAEGW